MPKLMHEHVTIEAGKDISNHIRNFGLHLLQGSLEWDVCTGYACTQKTYTRQAETKSEQRQLLLAKGQQLRLG